MQAFHSGCFGNSSSFCAPRHKKLCFLIASQRRELNHGVNYWYSDAFTSQSTTELCLVKATVASLQGMSRLGKGLGAKWSWRPWSDFTRDRPKWDSFCSLLNHIVFKVISQYARATGQLWCQEKESKAQLVVRFVQDNFEFIPDQADRDIEENRARGRVWESKDEVLGFSYHCLRPWHRLEADGREIPSTYLLWSLLLEPTASRKKLICWAYTAWLAKSLFLL